MTFRELGRQLQQSPAARDRAVGRYLEENGGLMERWVRVYGAGLDRDERRDLRQTALLAVCQVVHGPEGTDVRISNVLNAMKNSAQADRVWNARTVPPADED